MANGGKTEGKKQEEKTDDYLHDHYYLLKDQRNTI
jgi:hypothetical protein